MALFPAYTDSTNAKTYQNLLILGSIQGPILCHIFPLWAALFFVGGFWLFIVAAISFCLALLACLPMLTELRYPHAQSVQQLRLISHTQGKVPWGPRPEGQPTKGK